MITFKEVDKSYFEAYDKIPMRVRVDSFYKVQKLDRGLGGLLLVESPIDEYIKDLGAEEKASKYETRFDISNWMFYMAFDGDKPVGAITVACKTENVNMLSGRQDISVLWDIRVDDRYKGIGIGTKLFDYAVSWSRGKGFKQMKIETQNDNVPACKFYHKNGAILSELNEYAYYKDNNHTSEVQLIWYLDLGLEDKLSKI